MDDQVKIHVYTMILELSPEAALADSEVEVSDALVKGEFGSEVLYHTSKSSPSLSVQKFPSFISYKQKLASLFFYFHSS